MCSVFTQLLFIFSVLSFLYFVSCPPENEQVYIYDLKWIHIQSGCRCIYLTSLSLICPASSSTNFSPFIQQIMGLLFSPLQPKNALQSRLRGIPAIQNTTLLQYRQQRTERQQKQSYCDVAETGTAVHAVCFHICDENCHTH